MNTYWKRSACPYDCPDGCGLLLETDGVSIKRVKGDPEHPVTKGFLCRKMNHYERTIHHKDRILTPLKRTGSKGSGLFTPISWEEAIREITDTWKSIIIKDGAQAILPYSYAGTEHTVQNKCGEAFFHYMGASVLERTICSKAKEAGYSQILGSTQTRDPAILEESDLIIIWGSNVAATFIHAYERIQKAKQNGAKVILIETYETPAASLADEIILVRPGTDGALALGTAHIMKERSLIDYTFLEKYTEGWQEFIDSLHQYTPEKTAQICKISIKEVEQLALLLGNAKHPSILIGSGISRHGNGAMTVRSIVALQALTGALGDPKGGLLGVMSSGRFFNRELVTRPDFLTEPVRSINMNQLGDALCDLTPPVKSIYIYNVNPANVAPDQKKVLQGLMREDLFTVVHERFMTDTAQYADIVLPADTSVEHGDISTPYGHPCVQRTYTVIPPLGQSKSNWDTFCLLAKGMGFQDPFWQMSNDEIVEKIIGESSILHSKWTENEMERFQSGFGVLLPTPDPHDYETPCKKVQFINKSLPEEDWLPHYKENHGGNYPLRLVTAPHVQTLNSTFNEREDLVEKRGEMLLLIHPEAAGEREIINGDMIDVFNDLATVVFRAHITDRVKKGTVVAEGIYRKEQSFNQLTVNALLSQRLTDYGKASSLNDNTVDIRKRN